MKKRWIAGLVTALLVSGGVVVGTAVPASAHTPNITGTAACQSDGTYTVTWTYNITQVPDGSYNESKVITHNPEPSLLNGKDGQLQLSLWPEHKANGSAPQVKGNARFTFTQSHISGSVHQASVTIQTDWQDGQNSWDYSGSVTLGGNCTTPPPTPKDATAAVNITTAATCDANGVAMSVATYATLDSALDETPGSHSASFTALSGHLFADGTSHMTVSYSVPAASGYQSTNPDGACYQEPPTPKDASVSAIVVTDATCDATGTASLGEVQYAHLVGSLDQTPGTHTAQFVANDGHLFADGSTTLSEDYTIPDLLTGVQCAGVQPPSDTRDKTTVLCGDSDKVIDHYATDYVLDGDAWVKGSEHWVSKDVAPLTDDEYFANCAPDQPADRVVTTNSYGSDLNCDANTITEYVTTTTTPYVWDLTGRAWVAGESTSVTSHDSVTATDEQLSACPAVIPPTNPTRPAEWNPTVTRTKPAVPSVVKAVTPLHAEAKAGTSPEPVAQATSLPHTGTDILPATAAGILALMMGSLALIASIRKRKNS